ncbi:hypothetical protein JMG10_07650 [Nostoc ellipsosporum NOK]|nr:hypothetical protein [Nostoc ellipsosporum NOK]
MNWIEVLLNSSGEEGAEALTDLPRMINLDAFDQIKPAETEGETEFIRADGTSVIVAVDYATILSSIKPLRSVTDEAGNSIS